jgi:hypothetical protein
VQAPSQQTPSTQWPLAHWLAPAQATPAASFATHTPDEHQAETAQSESAWQSPWQAVAPQAYGLHGWLTTAGQDPAPSQEAAAVAVPAVQEAARQLATG